VPPTDTPPPPTDTPEPTATPTETPVATPEATNTPKPTPKPKLGKILFTSNRVSWDDVFVMREDGSNITQLTTMGKCYNAHFSPNGKRIVFDHDLDIWAMNADGSGQANLTNTSDKIEAFPVFSAGGSQIAYLCAWSGGFEIYVMNADGSDPHSITSGGFDWMPAWQPGGNKIAFSAARSGLFNIWTVNADGTDLKQVTTFTDFGALSPVWSTDGKQIGMVRYAGNSWEIWVVNADGTNPHKVTQIVGGDDGFIPDMGGWKRGKFVFGGYRGNWDVAVVSAAGGETGFLCDHPKDDKPSDYWIP
jgi:Tol biopolymer transport system component